MFTFTAKCGIIYFYYGVYELQFYTCVNRFGNNLLYRGYDNGKPVKYKIPFEPTLYELASRKTGIVSLDGKFLQPKSFTDMRSAK